MTTAHQLSFDVQLSGNARTAAERERVLADPGFGQTFTDHMISIDWTEGRGWHDARLAPYGPLSLDPATAVLHYAQELFEGLKAYRQAGGTIACFRPYANAARFNRSAVRMAMPELPEETFVESLELLVRTDREWVPTTEGHSLYLRPFMIATQTGLGVNYPSRTFRYLVIASPAGAYFAGGVKPVTVWLSQDYTRAAPGGTGFAKCGGNYAAAFVAQRQAVEHGCDQVVWLDAHEHRYVEEMGGMNLFFVFGDRLVTPPLTGTLLPGITRDSLLAMAADLGLAAEERPISIEEWRDGCASGELTEVF
ncbi:branched-chain amino acid aminotransferase, partial [Sphaerisporangium rufum]|uniref:branched-chain amino acid aminotransferase n=1 Tax=Sphaerisporangium rufum TaxID=1381558 RepID=UPI00194E3BA3